MCYDVGMSVRYTLNAYCDSCGWDIAEEDGDDLDELVSGIEHKADVLYREHIKEGKCN